MIQYSILLLMVLSVSIQNIQGQPLDKLGLNDAPELTQSESDYFNKLFKEERGDFNFNKAKAIFLTGTAGGSIVQKKDYFTRLVKPWLIKNSSPQVFFKILTPEEKIQSGGYDVIILSWVKVFTKRKQRKIIQKMNKLKK